MNVGGRERAEPGRDEEAGAAVGAEVATAAPRLGTFQLPQHRGGEGASPGPWRTEGWRWRRDRRTFMLRLWRPLGQGVGLGVKWRWRLQELLMAGEEGSQAYKGEVRGSSADPRETSGVLGAGQVESSAGLLRG